MSTLNYFWSFRYFIYDSLKIFLLDYVKTYKNFSSIFLNAFIKKNFPVNVLFRDGQSLFLKNAQQIRFFSSHNSHRYCVPEKTSITISPPSLPSVKFADWEYGGDLIGVFLIEEYKKLPVRDKIVIDIGGNVGDSAIYFALKGAKKVISFELSPRNYEIAKKNISQNKLDDKIIFNLQAASEKTGTLKINPNIYGNQAQFEHQENGISIPTISLDDITKKFLTGSAILKVDCEGCEYGVLNNTPNSVLKCFSHIQIEYHHGYKDLQDKLEKAGFVVHVSRPIRFNKNMFVGHIYAEQK